MNAKIGALFDGADYQAVIIADEISVCYLSGFQFTDGYLVCTPERTVLLADGRYFESASASNLECEVVLLEDAASQLAKAVEGIPTVAVETTLTVRRAERICTITGAKPSEQLTRKIEQLRNKKSNGEVECVVAAQRIAEQAFLRALEIVKLGMSEQELAAELEYSMRLNGAEGISFQTIAVSGPNSSLPHGVPGSRKFTAGDFITMDFGAVYCGYHSDMTRTVALGSVTDKQREVYNTVLEAGNQCLAMLCDGVSCQSADAVAREVIERAGYGKHFTHSTGHGVGLQIHESPNLSPRSTAVLSAGNIVTVEPGIYLAGRFGVRIEDMALITPDGCRNLTLADKSLIIL